MGAKHTRLPSPEGRQKIAYQALLLPAFFSPRRKDNARGLYSRSRFPALAKIKLVWIARNARPSLGLRRRANSLRHLAATPGLREPVSSQDVLAQGHRD